jgi:hypothetical protein
MYHGYSTRIAAASALACGMLINPLFAQPAHMLTLGETTIPGTDRIMASYSSLQPFGNGWVMSATAQGGGTYLLEWSDGKLSTRFDPEIEGVGLSGSFSVAGEWVAWTENFNDGALNGRLILSGPAGNLVAIPDVRELIGFSSPTAPTGLLSSPALSTTGAVAVIGQDNFNPHFLILYENGSTRILARESGDPVPGRGDARFERLMAPVFSPDGNRLLFIGIVNGKFDLFVWDRADDQIRLLYDPGVDLYPGTGDPLDFINFNQPYNVHFADDGSMLFYAYSGPGNNKTREGVLRYSDHALAEWMPAILATAGNEDPVRLSRFTFGPGEPFSMSGMLVTPEQDILHQAFGNHIYMFTGASGTQRRLVSSIPRLRQNAGLVTLHDGHLYYTATSWTPDFPLLLLDDRFYRVPLTGGEPEQVLSRVATGAMPLRAAGNHLVLASADQQTLWAAIWDAGMVGPPITLFSRFPGDGIWRDTPWGDINVQHYPHIWTDGLGWLYVAGEALNNLHFYIHATESWAWTSSTTAPCYYVYGDPGAWVCDD